MALSVLQTSFLGGELSPSMNGRIDDPVYRVGAASIENFLIKPTGVLQKRPGFRFVKEFDSSQTVRLIPFRFSSVQTLVLIFTHRKMYIATQGQMLLSGNSPYSVTTPFDGEDLWSLEYSQNADIVTFTSLHYPPYELRRYGATDWRFVKLSLTSKLSPPTGLRASATYPEFVSEDPDAKDPNDGMYDIIKAQYVVTAVDEDGIESEASAPEDTMCNYYITGATVQLSWSPVEGAAYYKIYRYTSGIYGYLGQTEITSLTDTGTIPDVSMTPPRYRDSFNGTDGGGRIASISVLDGGEGYWGNAGGSDGVADGEAVFKKMPMFTRAEKQSDSVPPEKDSKTKYATVTLRITGTGDGHDITITQDYTCWGSVVSSREVSNIQNDRPVQWTEFTRTSYYGPMLNTFISGQGFKVRVGNVPATTQTTVSFDSVVWTESGSGWFNQPPKSPSAPPGSADGIFGEAYNAYLLLRSQSVFGTEKYMNLIEGAEVEAPGTYTVGLKITDSTGSGAKANCLCKGGVIQSVTLLAQGKNYTSPQGEVESKGGSGARFSFKLAEDIPPEFPRATTQYDQRRVFAGSVKNPLKVWLTNAGRQNIMAYHIPLQDDDRIEIVAVTSDADIIKHAVALDSLILFTGSSELRVYTQNSDALSPRSVAVRVQSYVGANEVQPIVVNNSIVYIAARGGHPRQITYSYNSAAYISDDLAIRCPHLFDNLDIVDIAQSKAPVPTIWCVSSNGNIPVCTFIPEQKIVAWSKVTTDGKFESVCSVSEGDEDRVYVIVRRLIDGRERLYLEYMAPVNQTADAVRIMDSYLDAVFTEPQESVSGLDHLEGKEVVVFADGEKQSNKVVTDGTVTLDKESRHVAVGLPVTATLVSMPLDYAAEYLIMHPRAVPKIYLRCSGKGDIWSGVYPLSAFDKIYPVDRSSAVFEFQNQESVVLPLSVTGSWEYQSQIQIRSKDCLPLEILTLLTEAEYPDRSRGKL